MTDGVVAGVIAGLIEADTAEVTTGGCAAGCTTVAEVTTGGCAAGCTTVAETIGVTAGGGTAGCTTVADTAGGGTAGCTTVAETIGVTAGGGTGMLLRFSGLIPPPYIFSSPPSTSLGLILKPVGVSRNGCFAFLP